jgi:hypothetical protein
MPKLPKIAKIGGSVSFQFITKVMNVGQKLQAGILRRRES